MRSEQLTAECFAHLICPTGILLILHCWWFNNLASRSATTDDGCTMHLSLNRVLQTSLTDYSLLNNTNQYCIRQIYYCQNFWLRNGGAKDSGPPECDAGSMVVGFLTIRKITFKDKAVLSCLTPEDADITFLRNAGNHTLTTQCQISNWILILPDSNIKSGAFSAEDCKPWRVTHL